MSNPIRIGLAGAKFGAQIAAGFSGLENAAVVALAEPDETRRLAAASSLGVEDTFITADDMLFSAELDAIIVATPTYMHERHVQAAFDRGLHVLCASPVGTRGSEVSHVTTSAGLVGKTFMWSNPLRFDNRIAKARELVDQGKIGTVVTSSGCIQISDWPYVPDSWRLDRERGGGALLEVGTQTLDALWFAAGAIDPMEAMAARYDAFVNAHAKHIEALAEDTFSGMARLKDGSSLQFSSQLKAAIGSEQNQWELSIIGTEGRIDLRQGLLFNGSEAPQTYANPSTTEETHVAEAHAFLNAIRGETEPTANSKQALSLSRLLDAFQESGREKRAVSIKVERSLDDLFGSL